MDADVVLVPADDRGRMSGEALRSTVGSMADDDYDRLFAIVATSGTTNAGVIDDLAGTAARGCDLWLRHARTKGGAVLPDLSRN